MKKYFLFGKKILRNFVLETGGRLTLFQSIGSLIFHKTPHIELIKHNNTASHHLFHKKLNRNNNSYLLLLFFFFLFNPKIANLFVNLQLNNRIIKYI